MDEDFKQALIILGKNIREQRKEKGLSLKELSNKTGLNIKYLRKIEQGKAIGVTISKCMLIADIITDKPYQIFDNIN